jgi:hypothetical protein
MIITAAFSSAHGVAARYHAARTTEVTGVGGTMRAGMIRISSVSIGDSTLHDVASEVSAAQGTVFQQDRLDGAFGYDVLRRFVVTLDYPRRRMFFRPVAHFDAFSPQTGTGMTIDRTEAGIFVVTHVAEGSPAHKAGIVVGDVILAVNGRRAADLSDEEYSECVGRRSGTSSTYTLESRDHRVREVTLTSIEMLPPTLAPAKAGS